MSGKDLVKEPAPRAGPAPRLLEAVPFSLDRASLMDRLRVEPASDDARQLEALCALAEASARPKAMYVEAYVEPLEGDSVRIGGLVFTSRTLRRNLASVGRVFPFVATCGRETDEVFRADGDFTRDFWWDTIKADLLSAATRRLHEDMRNRLSLGHTTSMSPGSGDVNVWPIEQQGLLFRLLGDTECLLGVRLTESFLMIPNKTVSGIVYQAEKDFRTCRLCHREKCPNRAAPFDQALWDSIQGH
ncbi:MAG: vitamin B12 dependent methionine synthase [Lentisphaerae bacterium]|nr:vitamin B12 dependent methionine synthase [Lentisphaerota bacterium]